MIDQFVFIAELDDVLVAEADAKNMTKPSIQVITKSGKFLKGHLVDHNIRLSGGRLRGRMVLSVEGATREVDANDVSSFEKL